MEYHGDLRALNDNGDHLSLRAVEVGGQGVPEGTIPVVTQQLALGDLAAEVAQTTTAGARRPEVFLVSVAALLKNRTRQAAFGSKASDTGVPASVAA